MNFYLYVNNEYIALIKSNIIPRIGERITYNNKFLFVDKVLYKILDNKLHYCKVYTHS